MDNIAKIELCWKLYEKQVPAETIASSLKKHRATIFRWIKGIKFHGIMEFIRLYKKAKQRKRQKRIDYRAENLIIARRREKDGVCGQKIVRYLMKFHNIKISVAQTYRILSKHFVLEKAFSFFDGSTWLQTDNGSEFKGIFRKHAKRYCQRLGQITPYQKEENGYIESFNRTLRRECVGWCKYQAKDKENLQKRINEWLDEYHMERPHLSLNLQTPKEFVASWAERSAQT